MAQPDRRTRALLDALRELRRLDAARRLASRGSAERVELEDLAEIQRRQIRRLGQQPV